MKYFTQKAFIRHAFKMQALIMHALIMQTLQLKLLSKLAIICLLTTAGWLTFIGCAPAMDPVSKKAGDGTPTPDPVVVPSAYLAVGEGGKIALSKDLGVSWEAVASGTTENLRDIATDGSNFVAVASNGVVVKSTDKGETWSVISSTGISISRVAEIEYGNGVFALFTYKNSAPHYALYGSTDGGATWATGTIASGLFPAADPNIRFAYGGSRFLAVAGSGDEGTIAVSTDGLAYTSELGNGDLNFGNRLIALRIANGRFFIFNPFEDGYNSPNIYQSPTGGSQWTTNRRTNATDVTTFPGVLADMWLDDIAHSGSVYVFIGSTEDTGGEIMTSPTAMDGPFTRQTSPVSLGLNRIIFFKGKFVVAGSGGKIANGDAAGTTWTAVTSGTSQSLFVGEATANKIVFAGSNGIIVVSSDGTTWEVKSATGNDTLYRSLVLIE